LKRSNKELKKINEELDRFVYSASHDLRAPLVSILGLINIASYDENRPKKLEVLEMMRSSVKKLDDFIQDIIYYSRNARLDIKQERINALSIVRECLESYKFIDGADDIQTRLEIDDDLEITIDPGRLRIILNNLISNAIRFKCVRPGEPCFIRISMKMKKKKEVEIQIEDNGIGIEKKHLKKVFEMFYRAKEDKVGSGLGLYIVKETVEKLRGKIDIQSKIRKGTKFTIKLPQN
jgi:signal transduction histidine kinase